METLRKEPEVQIFAFKDSGLQTYGSFKFNLAGALEDDIIRQLNPPWNGARKTPTNAGGGVPAVSVASSAPDVPNPVQDFSEPQLSDTATPNSGIYFRVVAGNTYRRQGFFNVPVRYSNLFGPHGVQISISCRGLGSSIAGKINRTSNQNQTPRIFGGPQLRHWLQEKVLLGGEFVVTVAGPQEIQIAPA